MAPWPHLKFEYERLLIQIVNPWKGCSNWLGPLRVKDGPLLTTTGNIKKFKKSGGEGGGNLCAGFHTYPTFRKGRGGGKDSYLSNFNLNIQNIWTKFGIMKCYFSFFLIYFNAFYYIFKKFIIIVVLKRWCKGWKNKGLFASYF